MGRLNNTKRTLREKDLALVEEVRALGWREQKWLSVKYKL
jgi:hypothetical protein